MFDSGEVMIFHLIYQIYSNNVESDKFDFFQIEYKFFVTSIQYDYEIRVTVQIEETTATALDKTRAELDKTKAQFKLIKTVFVY